MIVSRWFRSFLVLFAGLTLTHCGPVHFTTASIAEDNSTATTPTSTPAPSPSSPLSPGLQTNNGPLDGDLSPITSMIPQIDPTVSQDDIYYVKLGVDNILSLLVQRTLVQNPSECQLDWASDIFSIGLNANRQIPMPYCSGFVLANTVSAKNGGSCTARAAALAPSQTVKIPNLVSVSLNLEIDAACVCYKDFDLVLGPSLMSAEVRAFAPQSECAKYFSEYAN